jgi:hypothetical protein
MIVFTVMLVVSLNIANQLHVLHVSDSEHHVIAYFISRLNSPNRINASVFDTIRYYHPHTTIIKRQLNNQHNDKSAINQYQLWSIYARYHGY